MCLCQQPCTPASLAALSIHSSPHCPCCVCALLSAGLPSPPAAAANGLEASRGSDGVCAAPQPGSKGCQGGWERGHHAAGRHTQGDGDGRRGPAAVTGLGPRALSTKLGDSCRTGTSAFQLQSIFVTLHDAFLCFFAVFVARFLYAPILRFVLIVSLALFFPILSIYTKSPASQVTRVVSKSRDALPHWHEQGKRC